MRFDALSEGRRAADEVLSKVFGGLVAPIAKELRKPNPLAPSGFDKIVIDLIAELARKARPAEGRAIKAFVSTLQRQWGGLSLEERDKAIARAKEKYLKEVEIVAPAAATTMKDYGRLISGAVREHLDLGIEMSPSIVDEVALDHLAGSQALYVRNAAGARVDALSEEAKDIIATGMKENVSAKEMGQWLDEALIGNALNRSRSYLEMVANVFAVKAKTFSLLSSFDEAGISAYQWEAVLDERTCDSCRFMHGKVFQVAPSLAKFAEVGALANPEDVKNVQPWLQVGKDDAGNKVIYHKLGDRKHVVAQVERSGYGKVDDPGKYGKQLSTRQLQARGISQPPLHARCRCTLSAVTGSSPRTYSIPEPVPVEDAPLYTPSRPQKNPPPANLPANIAELVRPLPKTRDYESSGPTKQQIWARKLNQLPQAYEWSQDYATLPLQPAPKDPISGKSLFPPIHGSSFVAAAKKKPQPVQVAGLGAVGSPGIFKPHALGHLAEKKGYPFDEIAADKTFVAKHEGKHYLVQSKSGGGKWGPTKVGGVLAKGEATLDAHVIDLDALAAKKAKPKKPKKEPPPPAAPQPARAPKVDIPAATPLGASDNILHQKVGDQRGSNNGGFYVGKDGVKRYVKFYDDPSQAHSEHLANQVYKALGHAAPESELFEHNGKIAYASKILEGETIATAKLTKERARKVLDGFVGDVLVGNWDAVGTGHDNVMVLANGGVARIDNGGSFLFRAKAGRKPLHVLNEDSEWEGFFDEFKNPWYSKVAKAAGVSAPEEIMPVIESQVAKVRAIAARPGGWGSFVDSFAPGLKKTDRDQMVGMLEARTKKLEERVDAFKNAGSIDTNWKHPQVSTTLPHAGLQARDVPVREKEWRDVIRHVEERKAKYLMPSGEKRSSYDAREEKSLKIGDHGPGDAYDLARNGIVKFTNGPYERIRDFEIGKPGHEHDADAKKWSKQIEDAFKHFDVEPTTVFRTIGVPDVGFWLKNDQWGLGKDGVGATSSSSWRHQPQWGHGKHKVYYVLRQRTGIPVNQISSNEGEDEILLPKTARYRTIGLSWADAGRTRLIVEAEEI